VNGVAGYNASTDTVHLVIYNHNNDMSRTTAETPAVTLRNIAPVAGNTVTVKKWIVDDTHGNFWPTWWNDKASRGIPDSAYSWSKYTMEVPISLKNIADRVYWYSREADYKALATLTSVTTTVPIVGNQLTLTPELDHHAVVFYEITNARSAGTTVVDELDDWSKALSRTLPGLYSTSRTPPLSGTAAERCERITELHRNLLFIVWTGQIGRSTTDGAIRILRSMKGIGRSACIRSRSLPTIRTM